MDVLSDVLSTVRLTGAIFFEWQLREPWVGESPPTGLVASRVMPEAEHVIAFHVLLEGTCWITLPTTDTCVRLLAGDVIILPSGEEGIASSARGMRAGDVDLAIYDRPTDRPLPVIMRMAGSGPPTCRIVCGFLGCDARPFNPILAALPPIMHAPLSDASRGWISSMFRMAAEETELGSPGGEAMLARLAELMFVEVLRKYIDQLPDDSRGWLSALRDRHVGQAMRLVHGQPARAWTIDALAREVGLSRSVFAQRFTSYVGVSPMHYLGRWRMQLATRRLRTPGVTVAHVSAEVGYCSEAAFNRAFKKFVGKPPGKWRKASAPASPVDARPVQSSRSAQRPEVRNA
jgi:AraC-like DNA-binding protein